MNPSNILVTAISNVYRLLPFRFVIIESFERGVFFRFGKDIRRVSHRSGLRVPRIIRQKGSWVPRIQIGHRTGIHFHWAWFENIYYTNWVEKVIETQYQTVTTKDEKEVTVSLTVSYQILNPRKLWTQVESFSGSLENISQATLTRNICKINYKDLINDPEILEKPVTESLNKKVKSWGVRILDVAVVNNPKARSIRLLNNPSEGI